MKVHFMVVVQVSVLEFTKIRDRDHGQKNR